MYVPVSDFNTAGKYRLYLYFAGQGNVSWRVLRLGFFSKSGHYTDIADA